MLFGRGASGAQLKRSQRLWWLMSSFSCPFRRGITWQSCSVLAKLLPKKIKRISVQNHSTFGTSNESGLCQLFYCLTVLDLMTIAMNCVRFYMTIVGQLRAAELAHHVRILATFEVMCKIVFFSTFEVA